MTDIQLLDQAIQIIADGSESKFCAYSKIEPPTVRTWRNRKSIPNAKLETLEWIVRSYVAEQKIDKAEQYFNLKLEMSKIFQS